MTQANMQNRKGPSVRMKPSICLKTLNLGRRNSSWPGAASSKSTILIQNAKGCPGDALLKRIANAPTKFHDRQVLDQIARCAPCSKEMREFLYKAKHGNI